MEAIHAPFNLFMKTPANFPHTSGTTNDYFSGHTKNEVANGMKIPSLTRRIINHSFLVALQNLPSNG